MSEDAIEAQRKYYAETAKDYNRHHLVAGDEHYIALEYIVGFMQMFRCMSVLDVGAGTGRSIRFLSQRIDGLRAVGVEPVEQLRAQSPDLDLREGSGESLPFADNEFDVVMASGVLHHVKRPEPVIAEMGRVASSMIFISDANRYGQGSAKARATKVILQKSGAWPFVDWLRTRGKGYMESEGDGIYYSYSVYDSLPCALTWGTRAFVIHTQPAKLGLFGPISESTHGLLVAVREPTGERGWAGY